MSKELGMHPIIATALANKALNMTEKKPAVTGRTAFDTELEIYNANRKQKRRLNLVKGIGITAGIILTIKGMKKVIKNQTDKDNSPEVQYAKRLRTAMSPSGVWWMPDGTNEKGIMAVAYEIADNPEVSYRDVQNAYKKLYGKPLSEHLESELDTDEYTEFLTVVSDDYNPENDRNRQSYVKYGKPVVTLKEASLYKTKDSYTRDRVIEKNSTFINVITTGRTEPESFWNQKRIELKKIGSNVTRWMNLDDVASISAEVQMPMSKAVQTQLKNKGIKLYKF